jgi:hypothetical protein
MIQPLSQFQVMDVIHIETTRRLCVITVTQVTQETLFGLLGLLDAERTLTIGATHRLLET